MKKRIEIGTIFWLTVALLLTLLVATEVFAQQQGATTQQQNSQGTQQQGQGSATTRPQNSQSNQPGSQNPQQDTQTGPQSQQNTQGATGTQPQGSTQTQSQQTEEKVPEGVTVTREEGGDYGGFTKTYTNKEGKVLKTVIFDGKGMRRAEWRSEHDQFSELDTLHSNLYGEDGKLKVMTYWVYDKQHRLKEFYQLKYGPTNWIEGRSSDYRYAPEGIYEKHKDFKTGKTEESFTPTPADEKPKTPPPSESEPEKKDAPKTEPPKTSVNTQAPMEATTELVGVVVPRDCQRGKRITGTFWLASYAKAFETVPAFYVYTFSVPVLHWPNGVTNWSSVQIGVAGYGSTTVDPDGEFSVEIPADAPEPLQWQITPTRFPWSGSTTVGTTTPTNFTMPARVSPPTLPTELLPSTFSASFQYAATVYALDLLATEFHLRERYRHCLEPSVHDLHGASEALLQIDQIHAQFDDVTEILRASILIGLLRHIADCHHRLNLAIRNYTLTPSQQSSLEEDNRWADFLDGRSNLLTTSRAPISTYQITPYWTSSVLNKDRLCGLRGHFTYGTRVYLDGHLVRPMAMTSDVFYFMPPAKLSAGRHICEIHAPGMPRTQLAFFYMLLTMWADQYTLHRGMKTRYHTKLEGVSGIPSYVWQKPFYPTDLWSPSELQNFSGASSLPYGFVTLATINRSQNISMTNQYIVYSAKQFEPQGFVEQDGPVTAVADGNFTIEGDARAYVGPLVNLGPWPGSSGPAGSTPTTPGTTPGTTPNSSLLNNWSFGQSAPPSNLNCSVETSSGGAMPPGTTTPTSSSTLPTVTVPLSHCMPSTAYSYYTQSTEGGGSMSVPVSNTTDSAHEEAKKRLQDANAKVSAAKDKVGIAHFKEGLAWASAMNKAARELNDRYWRTQSNLHSIESDWQKALDTWASNPSSAENNAKLESVGLERANAMNEFRDARQALIDGMSPEDRAAWQSAKDALDNAQIDEILAEEEQRDAEEALDKLPPSEIMRLRF